MNYISLSQIQKLASKRVVSYNRYNYFLVHLPTIQLFRKPVHLSTTQVTCLLINSFTCQLYKQLVNSFTRQLVYLTTTLRVVPSEDLMMLRPFCSF